MERTRRTGQPCRSNQFLALASHFVQRLRQLVQRLACRAKTARISLRRNCLTPAAGKSGAIHARLPLHRLREQQHGPSHALYAAGQLVELRFFHVRLPWVGFNGLTLPAPKPLAAIPSGHLFGSCP